MKYTIFSKKINETNEEAIYWKQQISQMLKPFKIKNFKGHIPFNTTKLPSWTLQGSGNDKTLSERNIYSLMRKEQLHVPDVLQRCLHVK